MSRQRLLFLVWALAQPGAAQIAEFNLRIDAADRQVLHVEAKIPIDDRWLNLGYGRPHAPEHSWGSYVRRLRASAHGAQGEQVDLRKTGPNRWRLASRPRDIAGGRLRLTYDVDLSHQESPFPYGHYGASYLRKDCVYFATSAVLIVSDMVDRALVRVQVPEDWRVSTPWAKASYRNPEYRILNRRELLEACMLLGTHQEKTLRVRGVDLTLAVGNDFPGAHDRLAEPLEKVVNATADLFGDVTRKRYLVVVNRAVHVGEEGGTSQYQGMSLLLPDQRGEGLDEAWAHALTHEFLHTWNGIAMRPAHTEGEWFNEGVTEYLTALLAARSGLVSRTYPLRYLTVLYDGYRKQAGISLAEGGRAKGENFFLIYGGGMAFGLLLDQEIRTGSDFQHGIEELMRRMFEEFGEVGGEEDGEDEGGYRVSDIARIASDLAGRDLSDLFDRYVRGEEIIPLEPSLRRLGLELTWTGEGGRASIRAVPRPDAEARRLRDVILGGLNQKL